MTYGETDGIDQGRPVAWGSAGFASWVIVGILGGMNKNLFDLEYQYGLYLERGGLKEGEMHPVQAVETKRAFFGAWGQLLLLLRDDMPEDEDEAVKILERMQDQVVNFWLKQKSGV